MTTNKKKHQLTHIDKSMRVDGKWTPEHTQAVKLADRIFNSPLREKQNIKRPTKKRK